MIRTSLVRSLARPDARHNLVMHPGLPAEYPADIMRDDFATWLAAHTATDGDVLGMVYNFTTTAGVGRWIYPRLTAEKILWHLARGETDDAVTAADVFMDWQQLSQVGALALSYGAWPSLITEYPAASGTFIACGNVDGSGNAAYYTGDGLVILTALCELYDATGTTAYKTAATLLGDWILAMIDDLNAWLVSFGYVGDPYPAPGKYIDSAGNRSDLIVPSECYCYIGALTHLTTITGDPQYGARVAGAVAFYEDAQHADGYWFDHYTCWPNYPAAPPDYDAGDWAPYHVGNAQVLADNVLNSALGAVKNGNTASAQACHDWLVAAIVRNGLMPGYLSQGGGHGFGVQDIYGDVVSTGQWRSLCQWLGESAYAAQAMVFLGAAQRSSGDSEGGWLWGIFLKLGTSATGGTDDLSPHVGFWATCDMSQFATSLAAAITYRSLILTKRIESLAVTPAGVDIGAGPQQMTITATYRDIVSTADVTATSYFHSDTPAFATISTGGLVSVVADGALNVYATIGAINDGAYLVVNAP